MQISESTAKQADVRFLNSRFEKALILENPDPSLDRYLREQGIEPERLPEAATQDVDLVAQRLAEGQHDLLFKRSRFPVDEQILQASSKLAAIMLCCIGDDSVDKEACAREGVLVMKRPGLEWAERGRDGLWRDDLPGPPHLRGQQRRTSALVDQRQQAPLRTQGEVDLDHRPGQHRQAGGADGRGVWDGRLFLRQLGPGLRSGAGTRMETMRHARRGVPQGRLRDAPPLRRGRPGAVEPGSHHLRALRRAWSGPGRALAACVHQCGAGLLVSSGRPQTRRRGRGRARRRRRRLSRRARQQDRHVGKTRTPTSMPS